MIKQDFKFESTTFCLKNKNKDDFVLQYNFTNQTAHLNDVYSELLFNYIDVSDHFCTVMSDSFSQQLASGEDVLRAARDLAALQYQARALLDEEEEDQEGDKGDDIGILDEGNSISDGEEGKPVDGTLITAGITISTPLETLSNDTINKQAERLEQVALENKEAAENVNVGKVSGADNKCPAPPSSNVAPCSKKQKISISPPTPQVVGTGPVRPSRFNNLPTKTKNKFEKVLKEKKNPPLIPAIGGSWVVKSRSARGSSLTSKIDIVEQNGRLFKMEETDVIKQSDFPDFAQTILKTARAINTNCFEKSKSILPVDKPQFGYTSSLKPGDINLGSHAGFRVSPDKPALILLGDQTCPEVAESNAGSISVMAAVIRAEDASFSSLKIVLKGVFKNVNKPLIPKGSIILVCMPIELLRKDVGSFLIHYDLFEKWLAALVATGRDPDGKDGHPGFEAVRKAEMTILPIFPPTNNELLLERIAIVNHVTKAKLAVFPPPHYSNAKYFRLLEASKVVLKAAPTLRTVKVGAQPLLSPATNFPCLPETTVETTLTVPTNCPYDIQNEKRSDPFWIQLLNLVMEIRGDVNVPLGPSLNIGNTLILKPDQKLLNAPLGSFAAKGRLLVVGQSTAGMMANCMKNVLNIPHVQYVESKAPLNSNKVSLLVKTLEGLKLNQADTVILDLTCNSLPTVENPSKSIVPLTTGFGKSKVFHLCDSEQQKLKLPSLSSIDELINMISALTSSLRGTGALVINLAPLPRFQTSCCGDASHGLQSDETPGTLNALIRDMSTYMGRTETLNLLPPLRCAVISVMDVLGPEAFLTTPLHSRDNVHPKQDFLLALVCGLMTVRDEVFRNGVPKFQLIPSTVSFKTWLPAQRACKGLIVRYIPRTIGVRATTYPPARWAKNNA